MAMGEASGVAGGQLPPCPMSAPRLVMASLNSQSALVVMHTYVYYFPLSLYRPPI